MRLAILADIHGNIYALQAVAGRLEQLQPDAVIVVGDLINAVPFSSQVVDFLRQTDWIILRGNHEFYYLDFVNGRAPDAWQDAERWGQLHWLVAHLRPDQGVYLAALPDDMTLYFPGTEPIRLAHGIPGQHRFGFTEDMPDDEIAAALQDVSQQVYVNAHTHVQFDRIVQARPSHPAGDPADFLNGPSPAPRTWRAVNPGSVGLPLNGDVRAQFAILESDPAVWGGWRVYHHRVAYDRRPALEGYITSGMLEAGGVMSELFYWELVTAEREIPYFFLWKRAHLPPDGLSFQEELDAYKAATGRDAYVRARDPRLTRTTIR